MNIARELEENQPTDYRRDNLAKFEKLHEATPIMKEFIGDSMAENFCNRSVKIKNIKLAIGERIYRDIFHQTVNGKFQFLQRWRRRYKDPALHQPVPQK